MKTTLAKLTVGMASAALVMSAFAPSVFAADSVTITYNGDGSHNTANLTESTTTTVTQTNVQSVGIGVTTTSSTGGNEVSHNTGAGANSVDTGAATSTTAVSVTGGSNVLNLPTPCGCESSASLLIDHNGTGSTNKANSKKTSDTTLDQVTRSRVRVGVTTKAKTGKNKVKYNTGVGPNSVLTSDATSTTAVSVTGPTNTVNP